MKQLLSSRGKRCRKRIVGAGRPVREATNIAANADAQLDGKEIDPAGRKRRRPADQREQQVRQLLTNPQLHALAPSGLLSVSPFTAVEAPAHNVDASSPTRIPYRR